MEFYFFFFKQKTEYEMRISDWSSDVCSSDLAEESEHQRRDEHRRHERAVEERRNGDKKTDRDGEFQDPKRRERTAVPPSPLADVRQIGRASCRERVCQYV